MSTRKSLVSRLGFSTFAVVALALILVLPTDVWAITFGDWAATQTWAASGITPASVIASEKLITSLAGISSYNWLGTPTTTLHLHKNQLTSIDTGVFVGLGKVTVLYLHTNQITSVESGDFTGLGSLTTLDLHGNDITSIPSNAFAELGSLKTLYLQTNQITSIESGDFTGLTSLTRLGLEDNHISSIESDDFAALGTLTRLDFDRNGLASIEPRAFAALSKMITLDLHGNTALAHLNLEGADFSKLVAFDLTDNAALVRATFRNMVLTQTAFAALCDGGTTPTYFGIGEMPGITELDLSGLDFAAITDLAPLYAMDHLTDLWLVDVSNMDADELDVLLDNLVVMEDPSVGGTLYMTQADYDAFNTAGGEKLTMWDAEDGHQVEIIGLGDANADGAVDDKDASILGAHWQQGGAGWLDGDFNGDGSVNDADAAILAAHWHEGMGDGAPDVPEPATLVMLAGAVLSLLLVRWAGKPGRRGWQ